MALAPLIYTPWNRVMQFDPQDPIWPNRDRFVLSNGHAPMLLWSHLSGTRAVNSEYERLGHPAVTLEDIRHFRQLDGRAPGHPENGWVSGVETTTGPLGQGVATSVGKAIAEKWLAHRYNRPGFEICVYNIYAVCEDGCLMERISLEAASLAAHLGLDNLCWIFDNNHITMEGNTDVTFTEDVAARFLAYGWNMLRVGDANDIDRIEHGIQIFRQTKDRLTFVVLDSHIGYGSPNKQGTAASHGEPLGEDEVHLTKRYYGWPDDTHFLVPQGVYDHFASGVGARGAEARRRWTTQYAELAAEIDQIERRELPSAWDRNLPVFPTDPKGLAGREASGKVLNALEQSIPWPLGGVADLGPSHKTILAGAGDFHANSPGGGNLHLGIREHAMAAIVNGLSLSKLRAYGASFFVFSDYARPAMRLSALMELPAILIFTRDGMGDGEEGRSEQVRAGVGSGPRRLRIGRRSGGSPEVILIASGSELVLSVEAPEKLVAAGIRSRVVSMPSWEIFEKRSRKYQESVMPTDMTARVAIEQARSSAGNDTSAHRGASSAWERSGHPRLRKNSRGGSASSRNGWFWSRRSCWGGGDL